MKFSSLHLKPISILRSLLRHARKSGKKEHKKNTIVTSYLFLMEIHVLMIATTARNPFLDEHFPL